MLQLALNNLLSYYAGSGRYDLLTKKFETTYSGHLDRLFELNMDLRYNIAVGAIKKDPTNPEKP